ncbi:erp2,4 [Aulographum hederae CBS 113979]|uniref:Erp2,4 n=1 Tax=Aulographum hederae CBS 113979 TaxID=1176131 RepID=A0A6G1GZV3_9PEZI|nr:erp2,4 [Aulographum hederae CBS 113979]
MQLLSVLCPLLALLVSRVYATALTYKLQASEKQCFFANVEQKGAKVAYYFAVQQGGSFDVDYSVVGPNEKIILEGTKERQGDFVFTANDAGEYRFCFNNEMSTFAEKTVDFEISVENEVRAQLPSKQGTTPEQTSVLEESIMKLSGQLSTINRNQKYFRTRENRNFSTVRSTERRIFNFSVMESLLMITMAGLQVFIVRFFFQGARKGEWDTSSCRPIVADLSEGKYLDI